MRFALTILIFCLVGVAIVLWAKLLLWRIDGQRKENRAKKNARRMAHRRTNNRKKSKNSVYVHDDLYEPLQDLQFKLSLKFDSVMKVKLKKLSIAINELITTIHQNNVPDHKRDMIHIEYGLKLKKVLPALSENYYISIHKNPQAWSDSKAKLANVRNAVDVVTRQINDAIRELNSDVHNEVSIDLDSALVVPISPQDMLKKSNTTKAPSSKTSEASEAVASQFLEELNNGSHFEGLASVELANKKPQIINSKLEVIISEALYSYEAFVMTALTNNVNKDALVDVLNTYKVLFEKLAVLVDDEHYILVMDSPDSFSNPGEFVREVHNLFNDLKVQLQKATASLEKKNNSKNALLMKIHAQVNDLSSQAVIVSKSLVYV